jgi:mycothiol synthase
MTELPEGWTTRRPTMDDMPAILALVHASDMASIGQTDFTADEVREALTDPGTDLERDCWVALDETGQLVAWAYPHNANGGDRDFIEVYTWPERGLPAQRPLLATMMKRVAERGAELGHDVYTVRAGAVPTEKAYIEALTDAGFTFSRQHARMQMSLDGVSPTPPPPPAGVEVRALRHEDDAELRQFHAVIQESFRDTDHFATDWDTWKRQVDAEPTKTWGEWLVAVVDGQIVGSLQSSDAEDNEGWVKRLGVARDHRRKGVGEALLRHAFAIYAANGHKTAGLGVDMANPTQAVRLYRAVGLTPLYEANIYETELDLRR